MAGAGKTVAALDAEIAALEAKALKLVGLPDSVKIGPNSFSGASAAYERVKNKLEELCSERDALVNNGGCRRPSRMNV